MPRFLSPDTNIGIVPIIRGGTSATSAGAAVSNLGAVPMSLINAPNGVAGLDVNGALTAVVNSSQIDWGGGAAPGELVALDVDGFIPSNLLPVADANNRGSVKGGGNVIIAIDGTMSVDIGALGTAVVGVQNDEFTDTNYYPMLSPVNSGTVSDTKVSSGKLSFNPFTGVLNATEFNSLSDIRYKSNIAKIEGALDKINQISGYTFTYTESNEDSAGVIAQEVQVVMPMLVGTNYNKLSVNYNGLIGLLIAGMQELQTEVNTLKSQLQGV